MKTWKRFDWQPGNGTRYDLVYGGGGDKSMIGWMKYGGSGGVVMFFTEFLHYTYVMEKLGINIADAVGILKFLELQGHHVGYPHEDTIYETCSDNYFLEEIT